jgi:hypothetical protein
MGQYPISELPRNGYIDGMSDASEKECALRRLEKSLAAVATFARIREELLLKRMATPLGPQRERIDQMVNLNQQTLRSLQQSLAIAEDTLARDNSASSSYASG